MSLAAHAAGLLLTLAATPVTLGLVLAMNRPVPPPAADRLRGEVAFAVKPPPRPKPPAEQRQERRSAPQGPRVALPPAPALGAELSGVDVGLGTLDLDPVGEVADEALGDLKDVVHTEETVDTRPAPRSTTPIEVPPAAQARNQAGRVVVSLRIGPDGAVRAARVVQADPPGVFDAAVLAAVRQWQFEPATYRGQPVEVWATLPIEFQP